MLPKNTYIFEQWSRFLKCRSKHETALNRNHCTPHVSECSLKVERGSISYCPDERLGSTEANRELDVTHTSAGWCAYTAYYFGDTTKYFKMYCDRTVAWPYLVTYIYLKYLSGIVYMLCNKFLMYFMFQQWTIARDIQVKTPPTQSL